MRLVTYMAKGPKSEAPKNVMVDCQNCFQTTKHDVLKEFVDKSYAEEPDIWFFDEFEIVRCRGCERISFRRCTWNSDDTDEYGEPATTVEVYPYRMAGRKMIEGRQYLPEDVRRVYEETHTALAGEAPVLGAIGIRAVVEAVCNDKKANGNSLVEKIQDLVRSGWLSPKQSEFLQKSRLLGNVAAHEMKPPSPSTLDGVLRIVENLLETVYVLPAIDSIVKP